MRVKARVTPQEFEELARPKLKLFLSVDLVGSTEFKQLGAPASSQSWLSFFVGFYLTFPNLFAEKLAEQSPVDCHLEARLWKSLGDELIFTAELTQRDEAAAYLRAFRGAVLEAVLNWKQSPTGGNLLLKATAWIAGFPAGNTEIPLEAAAGGQSEGCDYIGPLLDTGFRLKAHSTPRKFVVSADLAYFLVSSRFDGLSLFFDDDVPLKGVIQGKPYPIIWVDCDESSAESSDSIHFLKDRLIGRKPADPAYLKSYLGCWLRQTQGAIPFPFIPGDPFEDLCPPVDDFDRMAKARRELYDNLMVIASEDQNPAPVPLGVSQEVPSPLSAFLEENNNDGRPAD